MAKQLINVGSAANDKTGDKLRPAFIKVNNNTNELYSTVNSLTVAVNSLLGASSVETWSPNTNYSKGEIIIHNFIYYLVKNNYVSKLVFDIEDDLNNLTYFSQVDIPNYYQADTIYPKGFKYSNNNVLYEFLNNAISSSFFDNAQWENLNSYSELIKQWAQDTFYKANTILINNGIYYLVINDFTSTEFLGLNDISNLKYLSQDTIYTDYISSQTLPQGYLISVNNNLYQFNSTGVSDPIFTEEQWNLLIDGNISIKTLEVEINSGSFLGTSIKPDKLIFDNLKVEETTSGVITINSPSFNVTAGTYPYYTQYEGITHLIFGDGLISNINGDNSEIAVINVDNEAITNLQNSQHNPVSLSNNSGLLLNDQQLNTFIDSNVNNVLTKSSNGLLVDVNTIKSKLSISGKTNASYNITLYIDNVIGNDSNDPSTSFVKTISRAWSWLATNYYFQKNDEYYIYLYLNSDYMFTEQDMPLLDGSFNSAFVSLFLISLDGSLKTISDISNGTRNFTITNFSRYVIPVNIIFNTGVIFNNNNIVSCLGDVIFNKEFTAFNCKSLTNVNLSSIGSFEFKGTCRLNSINYIEFRTNLGSYNVKISSLFNVQNCNTVQFNCSLTEYSIIEILNINNLILGSTGIYLSNLCINPSNPFDVTIFNLSYINNLYFGFVGLFLNSSENLITRKLFNFKYCGYISGTLKFTNNFNNNNSIINYVDNLITFYYSVVSDLFIQSSNINPVFTSSNNINKLFSLFRSSVIGGSLELNIKNSVYSTTSRILAIDKYSEYLGENSLDLRGRITRRSITTNINLTSLDTVRQHIINQTANSLTINLPNSPESNQEFEIINSLSSNHDLIFNSITMGVGQIVRVQWDGVEWVTLFNYSNGV